MNHSENWHRESYIVMPTHKNSHGPYAPCPKSPTGNHCYHTIPPGLKRCCYCGKIEDSWRS